MKFQCKYCGEIIKDPLVESCGKNGVYYFCDVRCRDNYAMMLLEGSRYTDPLSFTFYLIKIMFSKRGR